MDLISYKKAKEAKELASKYAGINGVKVGSENGIIVDWISEKIQINTEGDALIFGNSVFRTKTDVILFSSKISNTNYLAFNYSSGDVVLLPTYNIDYSKYGIFGFIDLGRKNLHIAGDGYSVIGGKKENEVDYLFNGVLNGSNNTITIDFKQMKFITNDTTRNFIYDTKNGQVATFPKNKTYDLNYLNTDFIFNVAISYNKETGEFAFHSVHANSEIDYKKEIVFGMINTKLEQAFIRGVGYKVITNDSEGTPGDGGNIEIKNEIYFVGDTYKNYEPDVNAYLGTHIGHIYDYLIDAYEELRTNYPNYVSRKQIGLSEMGKVLYRYDFKTYDIQNKFVEKPIIYINAGIHGNETVALHSVISFFKELCDQSYNDDALNFIYSNAHLVVVPSSNPDGLEANTYKNANGVDLNRNFPTGWSDAITDPTDLHYPGTAPASESETRAMMDILDNENILCLIDTHVNGSLEKRNDLLSVGSDGDAMRYFFNAFGNSFTGRMKKTHPALRDHPSGLFMDRTYATDGTPDKYSLSLGKHAFVCELSTGFGDHDPGIAQQINKDSIGNLVLGLMRSIKELR